MGGAWSTKGEEEAYRILGGKRPRGRQRRMWVVNIKMDLREIGLDGCGSG
jgi:hypothetical protein